MTPSFEWVSMFHNGSYVFDRSFLFLYSCPLLLPHLSLKLRRVCMLCQLQLATNYLFTPRQHLASHPHLNTTWRSPPAAYDAILSHKRCPCVRTRYHHKETLHHVTCIPKKQSQTTNTVANGNDRNRALIIGVPRYAFVTIS